MSRPLRSVFRDIVLLASCVPLAACSAIVVPYDPDGGNGGDVSSDTQVTNACRPQPMGNADSCSAVEVWSCALPVSVTQPGIASGSTCDALCPDFVGSRAYGHNCSVQAADASGVTRVYCVLCRGGRRPEGWTLGHPLADDSLGAFFAALAELEAASIPAFRMLADDLERFGAPARLVTAARAAIDDERVHTRMTRDLAKRFGGTPRSPRIPRSRAASIESLAMLNAAEGLVGESFGALLATYQSMHSADANVRAVMTRIAEDESRHADLAHEIACWADTQLDDAGRERVRIAREEALAGLRDELDAPTDPELVRLAGIPDAGARDRLFGRFADHVRAEA